MPTLADIAVAINGRVDGDGAIEISHCCDITAGTPGGITYVVNESAAHRLPDCGASAVILDESTGAAGLPAVRVNNPAKAFAQALVLLHPHSKPSPKIHPAAVVGEAVQMGDNISIGPFAAVGDGAVIGNDVTIGAGAVIGRGVVIGDRVNLHPRVVLYDNTMLGNDVSIHAGTVIGSDGFGYVTENDVHTKIPQVGRTIIGDRVEIGANCAIDRGSLGDTVIGEDTKLDNLVHIAHNVKIGVGCLIAGEVGIAGSTTIGNYVTMAGQVGVISHISIGDRTVIASKSAVFKPIAAGQFYGGYPADDQRHWLRTQSALKGLPELVKRVRALEHAFDAENIEKKHQEQD